MNHAWGRWHFVSLLAAVLFGLSCTIPADGARENGSSLSATDSAAVVAADQAYADAWLSGDEGPVMGTLHEDAVIVPSGLDARAGSEAVREFWFPANSPPTIVERYELDQVDVGGSSALAYVRGTFTLSFRYEGEAFDSHGTYLTLLRPDEAGTWRISHRMWNDH